MIIAMACTCNWYHYLAVLIYSLLRTTKTVDKIYLLLETDDIEKIPELKKIKEKYPFEIILLNFNNIIDDYLNDDSLNRNTKFSNFTFARLCLPQLVKEDKVLYIDVDTIILKDLSDLWDTNIDDYYIAGCEDYGVFELDRYRGKEGVFSNKYVNAGVILINNKKILEDNLQIDFFALLNMYKFIFPDQDVLNYICGEKKLIISSINNYALGTTKKVDDINDVRIIHYVGDKKNWVHGKKYSEFWYDVEKDFYDEFGFEDLM